MHRAISTTAVIIFILTASAWPQPAVAEDAKEVFDSLYGPKLKQVSGTLDRADDVALAKEMVTTAKASGSTPGLQALLCDAVYDLGNRHPDGYSAAAEAMRVLAETQEAKRGEAREKLLLVLTKQSRAAKPEDRDAASDALIDLLVTMGDGKAQRKEYGEAAADFRRAYIAAQQRKNDVADKVKAKLEWAVGRDRAMKQIERLQAKLLSNANDTMSAEEIVKLFMVELDDPAEAAHFIDRVKDSSLAAVVRATVKTSSELTEAEHLTIGEWYRTQVGLPSSPNPAMLARAVHHLKTYVDSHGSNDLSGQKAKVMLDDVNRVLASIAAASDNEHKQEEQWISKGAKYLMSSTHPKFESLPALLSGEGAIHLNAFACHSQEGLAGQYLTIDLGANRTISSIWIENRRDGFFKRAEKLTVWVSSKNGEKGMQVWQATEGVREWTINLDSVKGRYVTIGQPDDVRQNLHLAQVKVFGTAR